MVLNKTARPRRRRLSAAHQCEKESVVLSATAALAIAVVVVVEAFDDDGFAEAFDGFNDDDEPGFDENDTAAARDDDGVEPIALEAGDGDVTNNEFAMITKIRSQI